MKQIDRGNPQKLYIQVFEILRKKIESGEWPVESQIPIDEKLCRIYGVSKATVKTAIQELARQGYLMRHQGKGTFVCKRIIPEGLTMSTSFREFMLEAGIAFSTQVLAQTVTMPVDDLGMKLNIPEDKHLIYIRRLQIVDGEPVFLQESYIPYYVCPSMLKENVADNSVVELLEKKYEITITKVKDYIQVVNSREDESKLLNLPKDSPVLLLEQHFYSAETQVMYTRSIKRTDRFRFSIEFEKK